MARIALITGGAGGLGFATALRLAADGIRVALSDLDEEAARAAAARLDGHGHLAIRLDVTDEAEVASTFARVQRELGPIAILAHFAGALEGAGPSKQVFVGDISLDSWTRVVTVNATGTFLCVREMSRLRRSAPVEHGRIITVSSLAGQMGGNIASAGYAASKAAVIGFTKNVARQLAPLGITVNTLAPGAIDTQMFRIAAGLGAADSVRESGANVPMGRIGEADEVGAVAAFLASPAASYVTGQVIGVNGGVYM